MNREEKKQTELDNYLRELEKSDNVLTLVEKYFKFHAAMNASLHCDEEVVPSPLYKQIIEARKGIKLALRKWKRKIPKFSTDEAAADVKMES
jgi:hypothetical protein